MVAIWQRDRVHRTMEEVKQRCLDEQEKRLEKEKQQEIKDLREKFERENEEAIKIALEKEHQTHQQQLNGLENTANARLKELEREVEAANKKANGLGKELEVGKEKTNGLKSELNSANAKVKELERGLEAANKNANSLQGEVNGAKAEVKELKGKVEIANNKANGLEEVVKAGNKKTNGLGVELNGAKAKVTELEGKVKVTEKKANGLEERLNTADTKANRLEETVNTANKSLDSANKSKDEWRKSSRTLQEYVQSQLSLLGISDTTIQCKTVSNWRDLNAAKPAVRADVDDAINHYRLMFVVPPTELAAVETGDLAIANIWFLVQSRLEALLSIRHYACRPNLSPKQLAILQGALAKAIRVIVNAKPQDVFAPAIVAIHAIGWLNARVQQLSDHEERTKALEKLWHDLLAWLNQSTLASESRIIQLVCVGTPSGEDPPDATVCLDSSNSALEPNQWLLPDPDLGQFAWFVGGNVKLFGREDVRCVDFVVSSGEIVLHFKEVGSNVCLCRGKDYVTYIVHWVREMLGRGCLNYV